MQGEEGKLETIKEKALKRAVKFEEKARVSGKKLVIECLEEKERKWGDGKDGKWTKMRKKVLEEVREEKEKKDKQTEDGEDIVQVVIKRMREKEERERRKKIEGSRYNKEYKKIIKGERPRYLSMEMKIRNRKTLARFRCSNEVREREFWKTEGERTCRLCGKKGESMWHVLKEYNKTRQEEEIEVVLGEDGQGLKVLKEIENKWKEREEEKEKDKAKEKNKEEEEKEQKRQIKELKD